jgi:hypothetical protein
VNTGGIIRVRHITVLLTVLLLLNTSCSFNAPTEVAMNQHGMKAENVIEKAEALLKAPWQKP